MARKSMFSNAEASATAETKPTQKATTGRQSMFSQPESQSQTQQIVDTTSKVDQFGLPKSYISAAPAGTTFEEPAKKESFWTKAAKTVLPKSLEDFFGLNKSATQQKVESSYDEAYAYEDLQRLNKELKAGGGKLEKQTFTGTIKDTPIEKYLPFVSAVPDIVNSYQVYQSAKRLEKGENTLVDDYRLAKFAAENNRDKTFMAKVASVLVELPSFGGELLATGGIYTVGKEATEKAIQKTLTNALGKKVGTIATKIAGNVVGGTLQTIPARLLEISAGTIQNMTPGYSYQNQTEKGDFAVFINSEDKGENFWNAAKLALGDQWVEVVSEHSGGIFNEMTAPVKSKLLKVGLFNAFLKANPNATSSTFMKWVKGAGWNGTLAEIGEERIGEALRGVMTPLGLSKEGYKLPSKEQLAVELVSFAIPGVMIGASNKALERLGNGTGGIVEPPKIDEPTPISEAENIIGARDILIVGRGGTDLDGRAMSELNTTINNYHTVMASPVIEILNTDKSTLANVKVVPYPDGKWGYSFEINTPENGVLSDFLTNKLVNTREEAVAQAKVALTDYAAEQMKTGAVSDETKAEFENIIRQVGRVQPNSDVPIEVRKQEREVAKPVNKEDELINELQDRIEAGDTAFIEKMKARAKGNPKLAAVLDGAIKKAEANITTSKPVKRSIKDARDAAKDMIRGYVERGDTLQQLKAGQLGVGSPTGYSAGIGGYVNGKAVGADKVVVTRIAGKDLPKPQIFSLKELFDEIKGEKVGKKKEAVKETVKEVVKEKSIEKPVEKVEEKPVEEVKPKVAGTYDKVIELMSDYRNQEGYPVAQGIILGKIDREVATLEAAGIKNVREAVSHLMFDFGIEKPVTATPQEGKLPKDLSGAKPRYGYQEKKFTLTFNSDTDKALYIVAQEDKSKADSRYMDFLKGVFPNDSVEQIVARGVMVRSRIKEMARDSEPGNLVIEAIRHSESRRIFRNSLDRKNTLAREKRLADEQKTKIPVGGGTRVSYEDFIKDAKKAQTPTPRFAKPTKTSKKTMPAHEVAAKIIPKRPNLPILSEFRVKGGKLTAGDLEIAITLKTDLPDGMYKIVGKEAIKTNTDPTEYPTVSEPQGVPTFTVSTERLSEVLKAAVISTSDSATRPELEGVFLKVDNGQIAIASTDAFRMYVNHVGAKIEGQGEFILGVPEKAQKVISALGDKVDVVIGGTNDNQVMFVGENGTIITKRIDSGYPELTRIIPSHKIQYQFDRKELLATLKELKPFVNYTGAINVSFAKNKATLIADNKGQSLHKEITVTANEKAVNTQEGVLNNGATIMPLRDEKTPTYNVKYLIDALSQLPEDSIYFYYAKEKVNTPLFISNEAELEEKVSKPSEMKGFDLKEFQTPIAEAEARIRELFDEDEVGFIINNNIFDEKGYGGLYSTVDRNFMSSKYRGLIQVIERNGLVSDRILYHESFHAYFNKFLTQKERDFALKTVMDSRMARTRVESYDKETYKTLADRAEEWLADDFARYVNEKESSQLKGLAGLFEKIRIMLRNWVRKTANVTKIYDDILGKVRNGVYSTEPAVRAFAIKKRQLEVAIQDNERTELIEQLINELRQDAKSIPSGYASAGANSIGTFEDLSGIQDKTPEELKLYNEVKALIEKYAKSIGEDYLPRKALGVYYRDTTNIRIKGMNDVSVAAHEITHFLDFAYKISERLMEVEGYAVNGNPIYSSETYKLRQELSEVYENYYPGGKAKHKLSKRMIEGFATLLQKYTEQPTSIKAQFPNVVKEFLTEGGEYYEPVMGEIISDLRGMVGKYQGLPALDKIGARIINDEVNVNKESFLNLKEKVKTEMLDNIYPEEVLAKKAGVQFTVADPSLHLRNYNSSIALINNNLFGDRGYWGWRNEELVKLHDHNWKDLYDDIGSTQQTQEFGAWLVARREHFAYKELVLLNVKLIEARQQIKAAAYALNEAKEAGADLEEYASDMARVKANYDNALKNYTNAQAILLKDGFTQQEVDAAYLENKDRFEKFAETYDILVGEDLRFLNDVGLITDSEYRELSSKEGYASFKRFFYDELVGEAEIGVKSVRFGSTKVSSMLKRSGSQKPIINPLFSALTNHAEITRKALKQVVYNKNVEIALRSPELGVFQRLQLKVVPDGMGRFIYPQEKDPNIIMGRIRGKRVPVLVDATIKRTIDEVLTFQNINAFEEVLLRTSRFFSKSTTGVFVGFTLSNIPIDTITSLAQTRNNIKPLYDPIKKLYASISDSESPQRKYFQEYMVMGGERQTLVGWQDMSPNEFFKALNREKNGIMKAISLLERGVDILAIPSKYSEIMTRATEYIKAREAGKPAIVALEEAGRVTAPFHHIGRLGGGRFGKTAIKSIPYFNAGLQVLGQAAETMGTPQGKRRMLFVGLAVSVASVAGLAAIMAAGSDDQKRQYADLDPNELVKYIWYPLPGGVGLGKIRVPDLLNVLGTVLNMGIADSALKADYGLQEYLNAATAWLPAQLNPTEPIKMFMSWIPQLVKPGILTAAGVRDFPNIIPLESQTLQNREPEFRYNEQTSWLAKKLGATFGMSPIKIDYLIAGYGGRSTQYVIGKPGAFDLTKQLMKDYYVKSGRKFQQYYDLKEKNDQAYEAYQKGRTVYKLGERSAILKERAKLSGITDLLELYNDIDEKKKPDQAKNLRDKILKQIDAL